MKLHQVRNLESLTTSSQYVVPVKTTTLKKSVTCLQQRINSYCTRCWIVGNIAYAAAILILFLTLFFFWQRCDKGDSARIRDRLYIIQHAVVIIERKIEIVLLRLVLQCFLSQEQELFLTVCLTRVFLPKIHKIITFSPNEIKNKNFK